MLMQLWACIFICSVCFVHLHIHVWFYTYVIKFYSPLTNICNSKHSWLAVDNGRQIINPIFCTPCQYDSYTCFTVFIIVWCLFYKLFNGDVNFTIWSRVQVDKSIIHWLCGTYVIAENCSSLNMLTYLKRKFFIN